MDNDGPPKLRESHLHDGKKPSERVEAVLRLSHGPAVLDIGCVGNDLTIGSRDWIHAHLRDEFPEVWGLDISIDGINRLQRWGWPHLLVSDAQNFCLRKKFDSVVAGETIEHLSNPGAFLEGAKQHLKPDGALILTTPFAFGLYHWMYAMVRFPRTCPNEDHVQWFCPQTIASLASKHGLHLDSCHLIAGYGRSPRKWPVRLASFLMRTAGRLLPIRLRATTMVIRLIPVERRSSTVSSSGGTQSR